MTLTAAIITNEDGPARYPHGDVYERRVKATTTLACDFSTVDTVLLRLR